MRPLIPRRLDPLQEGLLSCRGERPYCSSRRARSLGAACCRLRWLEGTGRRERRHVDPNSQPIGIDRAGRPERRRLGHRLEPRRWPGSDLRRLPTHARGAEHARTKPGPRSATGRSQSHLAKFENAERECAKLVPQDAPPAIVSHPVAPLLAFAKCMRSHGVTSFPDPDNEGHFHDSQMQAIDPNSSLFQRAITTCRPLADNEPIARVP